MIRNKRIVSYRVLFTSIQDIRDGNSEPCGVDGSGSSPMNGFQLSGKLTTTRVVSETKHAFRPDRYGAQENNCP
ncbi:MAG: hypothetical protein ACE5IY_23100 [bacterium]